jgi:CRP/FNR family transcriptional regulator, anaerobic regulatory protein
MSAVFTQASNLYAKTPYVKSEACRPRAGRWSSLTDVCDLLHVSGSFSAGTSEAAFQHIRLKAGQRLFTIGQNFDMLYIVNSGFLKTVLLDDAGNERVLSFPMRGDVLGVDGIHAGKYMSEAIALSNCDVIMVPFKAFASLGKTYPELEISLYRIMSQELIRDHTVAAILGSLRAEARIARFLITLSERFSALGYSGTEFNLRMTRQDIGSHLGLTLETASRTMCALNKAGYIAIHGKSVCILEPLTLKSMRRLPPSKVRHSKKAMTKLVIRSPSNDMENMAAA